MLTREEAAKAADDILARHRAARKSGRGARPPIVWPVYRSAALNALRPAQQAEVLRRARSAVGRQACGPGASIALLALAAWCVTGRPSPGAFDLAALAFVAVERGRSIWRTRAVIASLLARR
jgi:hypothetical protein